MASRLEIALVYCAGVAQGLALVSFPAASAALTSAAGFGFDSTRYGLLFVPQVICAIGAAALAPQLAERFGLRNVLLAGLARDIAAMSLLALSLLLIASPPLALPLLLASTTALGFRFDATAMALNSYA